MANRYNRVDNSSPVQQALKADDKVVPSSAHDLSHIHNGNAIFGALTPVCVLDVVPSQKVDINLSSLLEFRNPTTRQLFNSARVYFHARYARLTDLWEGAKNWLDNGRSGKLNLSRPNLLYHGHVVDSQDSGIFYEFNSCTPLSLLNYLGLPSQALHSYDNFPPLRSFQPAFDFYDVNYGSKREHLSKISESPSYFPADLCMMYQRDWRDFYSNKNLLQNNTYWFPDNEEHFILSYSCESAACIKYEDERLNGDSELLYRNVVGSDPEFTEFGDYTSAYIDSTPLPNNPSTSANIDLSDPKNYPNLSSLKFVQLRGDRFTTASPFPDLLRGDMPIINLTQDDFLTLTNGVSGDPTIGRKSHFDVTADSGTGDYQETSIRVNAPVGDNPSIRHLGVVMPASTITMSDIYTLETLTAFRKKMGMTNGDYNEMIEAQFGFNPRVHDRHSTYIGGFYQDFAFSSVTQLSESNTTPLGTKAGQGISSGHGSCGQFTCPDFGWIIVYMYILPDVYYTQGKPRMFSKQSNLEMYFPLFNNLPAQGIRNDELYISGDEDVDSEPFAYEDRYAEFKSRQNRVSGFMALTHSQAEYDSSRVIARRFESLPSFNNNFVSAIPENIDMEVFSVNDEPPIDFSIGFNIRSVFPGPYVALEGSLSSPRLA